jgi:hypothetical protein
MTSRLEWVLRIGVFGTFLGHGLLAISVNPSWIPYLVSVGINPDQAKMLMPVIGSLDIIVALWVLLKPNKYVVLWAVLWAMATAIIRPLSGELFLTFVERAANWAAPLALYLYKFKK